MEPITKNSEGFDKTNMETVDISVDAIVTTVSVFWTHGASKLSQILRKNFIQKRRGNMKKITVRFFSTGGQQVPASKPPATGSKSPPSKYNTTYNHTYRFCSI